jgi:predicted HAD superfamily Cof-like phosphohydrolase
MREYMKMVEEFHIAFDQKDVKIPTVGSLKQGKLRYELLSEETEEYIDAVRESNLVEIADALGDQLYIIYGTILKHGLQNKIEAVFKEIHRSNMSKLGADGKPIYREDGKILKGPEYFKPNIKKILED